MIEIAAAASPEELDQVRRLLRTFVAWHRARHLADRQLIDAYFAGRAFEDELAALPGKYAAPQGRLLMARWDGQTAGCAALRRLDPQTCEMKRMFVYPQFHGQRVGRALADRLIEEGRRIGYLAMRLDTSFRQTEAQNLYRKIGFKRIAPYYDLPDKLKDWLVFMELKL